MPDFDTAAARAGDVVVVPFPYSDRFSEKRRPALIISAPPLHRKHGLVWLAMITSARNPRWDCDIVIQDHAACGLPAPSVVRPAKIACVEPARILRTAGRLAEDNLSAVRTAVSGFLG